MSRQAEHSRVQKTERPTDLAKFARKCNILQIFWRMQKKYCLHHYIAVLINTYFTRLDNGEAHFNK